MKRLITEKLKKWQSSATRKPLILMGARQIGKTTVLKKFAQECFDKNLYLNFEDNPELKTLFEKSLKPENIVANLELAFNTRVEPSTTLIIFDEVQECPNALNSLKYFNEQANNYHLCAAGSLLGVKLEHTKGFPVGKVNFLDMYPMNFLEFLWAKGESQLIKHFTALTAIEPLIGLIHDKAIQLHREYLFVGGMPEAVFAHINGESFEEIRNIQNAILRAYQLDFAKHAPTQEVLKISQVWDAITSQLAKENKKFIYSAVRKGSRAKDFENAIQWLKEAGVVLKASQISKPTHPLSAYANLDHFKLYLLDVGLLGAMANISAKSLLLDYETMHEFKGAMTENYVAQCLTSLNQDLFYWCSNASAEIDFIANINDNVVPLEAKSGKSKFKRSLTSYIEKYHPSIAIRLSPMNLILEEKIINIPLYLAVFINQILTKISP